MDIRLPRTIAGVWASWSSSRCMAGRTRCGACRRRGRGVGLAGDFVQVGLLVLIESQRAGEGGEHGRGGLDAALLQARVVIHADRRELRDFLAAEPADLAADACLREADFARGQLGAPGPQEGTELAGNRCGIHVIHCERIKGQVGGRVPAWEGPYPGRNPPLLPAGDRGDSRMRRHRAGHGAVPPGAVDTAERDYCDQD